MWGKWVTSYIILLVFITKYLILVKMEFNILQDEFVENIALFFARQMKYLMTVISTVFCLNKNVNFLEI